MIALTLLSESDSASVEKTSPVWQWLIERSICDLLTLTICEQVVKI